MSETSKRRSIGRIVLVVAGVVVLAIGLAWVALAVLFPPARVRALVAEQLSRSLNREVRFADAGLSLFPPVRLTVQQLSLSEAGGFANGITFQAQAAFLDLDVPALLSRRIVVRRLALEQPGLHVILHADGTTNLDGIAKPAPSARPAARPMDFTVNEFSLRRARLLIDDLKAGTRRTVMIDSRVALASQQGGKRYVTSGATTFSEYGFGPVSVSRIADLNGTLAKLVLAVDHQGVFDMEQKRLALDHLDIAFGRARLAVRGVVDDPGPNARFRLAARGEAIQAGELLDALAKADASALHGIQGSGRLDFDLAIEGSLGPGGRQQISGPLRVTNASFRYPGAPAGVDALNFRAQFAPDSLGIGDLTARVSGQPVRAQFAVTRFSDPLVVFAVQGNLDLATVAPMVAPKDTRLTGRADVNVHGRGRAKDPSGMALDGTAKLMQVTVEAPAVPKRLEAVNGLILFSAGRAEARGLSAKAGGSAVSVDARVTRPLTLLAKPGTAPPSQVEFSLASPHFDVADLLPPQSGPPVVLNATGSGHVQIQRFINDKLDVSNLRADVGLEPGIILAPHFSMNGYGGVIGGSARLDLRDPANPGVSLKATVDSLSADALLSAFTPARNFLTGALNTAIDLSVSGATPAQLQKTLTAVGTAEFLRGQIGPGPVLKELAQFVKIPSLDRLRFNDAKLPFHIEHGRIVSEPTVLRGNFGEWRVAGAIGFDGALDYAVSATLPPAIRQSLGTTGALAAGALSDPQGNLLIDLHVGGTAKAPRIAWDSKAMRDRLTGNVSQAIAAQEQKMQDEMRRALAAQEQAAADSARHASERFQQALKDSLRRRQADLLRDLFGGGAAKDTTAKP